jgi:hypothetical protein
VPGRLGPRFALEAAFLILLAVGAAVADLSAQWIVVVMGAGWVLVGLFEFAADRLTTMFPPLHRYAAPPRPEPEREPEPATIVVPAAAEEPPAEPRRRFWRRRRPAAPEAAPEPEPALAETPTPRHVHILPRDEEGSPR